MKQNSYIEYLETVVLSLLVDRQTADIIVTDTEATPPLLNAVISAGILKETIVSERTKRRASVIVP